MTTLGIHYYDAGLQWFPVRVAGHQTRNGFSGDVERGRKIERRLDKILASWEYTPYSSSIIKQGPSGGVYCTAFVARVLDELFGRDPTPMPDIPHDASMHNPKKARAALRWFFRSYPGSFEVKNLEVEPGDVIITGPVNGGPGHALIVGPRPNTMWQADGNRVHYTGMFLPEPYELHEVRRFYQREEWVR